MQAFCEKIITYGIIMRQNKVLKDVKDIKNLKV